MYRNRWLVADSSQYNGAGNVNHTIKVGFACTTCIKLFCNMFMHTLFVL